MIKEAIVKIVNKGDLSYDEAYAVMNEIMSGETTPTQNAAFLAALSTKSEKAETTDEIAGCAAAMRDHATKVDTGMDIFEIVGTGGDNAHSFNISTTAGIIAAAAGVRIAKHGNRAASSRSGAADCLEALGVNIDSLLVSQPDSGEQAREIAEALVRSGAIDVLVVDSVAALTTKAEIDGEMGDSHVGQLARLMSQAMRKLTAVISKSKCVAIFINQVREKIGVMYGNPETTPGGRALKFYASVRMEVRRGEPIKDGSSQIGNRTKVKINKNKVAPPFREAEFDILYGQGISRTGEVIDVAVELGIVKKGGAWFSYEDQKLGQGRENAKKTLEENPDLMKEIEDKIMEHKDELMATSKKKKKKSKLEAAAAKAAGGEDAEPGDIVEVEGDGEFNSLEEGESLDISAEDDFEEFDPA